MIRTLRRSAYVLSTAFLVVTGCFLPAQAAPVSWNGGPGDSQWSSGTNWSTGTAPGASDIAVFDLTSYTNLPGPDSATVSGVQIGDGTTATAPITLAGTLLTTGSDGISLMASAGSATFSMPITLASSQTFTNNSASALTISNSITNSNYLLSVAGSGTTYFTGPLFSGGGGLTISGPGLLQISGSNISTQSPTVTVNGGTLQLAGGNNNLPVNTTLALANSAGATFDLNSQNQQIQYLSGGGTAGGSITLGSGTLTIAGGNTATTFAGVISGPGAVVKTSGNTMLFSGSSSTYSGGTTLGGNGTVTFSTTSALSGNNLVSGPFGTGPITFTGGGNLSPSGTTALTIYNPLVFSNGASGVTLASVGNSNLTLAGSVTLSGGTNNVANVYNSKVSLTGPISGPGGLNVTGGGGAFLLSGSNTYSGGTVLSGGNANIQFNGSSVLSSGTLVSGPLGTGPITFTGVGSFSPNNSTLTTLNNPLVFSNGAANINFGAVGSNKLILAGSVTLSAGTNNVSVYYNSSGSLTGTISGAGGLGLTTGTLVLTASNSTYSGGTIVNGTNTYAEFNGGSVLSSGTLVSGPLGTGPITFTGGGYLSPNNTTAITIYNPVNFSNGAAGITLASVSNSNLTLAGSMTVSAGTNTIAGGSGSSFLTGPIGGPGDLSVNAGTIVLSGSNTFTGGVTLAGGQVKLAQASQGTVGNITSGPLGTGTLVTNNNNSILSSDTSTSGLVREIFNPVIINSSVQFGAGYQTGDKIKLSGPVTLTAPSPTFAMRGQTEIAGVISGTGGFTTNYNDQPLILSGNNTYSGTSNLTGSVQVRLAQASQGTVGNIVSGPLGTGTVVLNNCWLESDTSTSGLVRQIFNPVIINGSFQFGNYQTADKIKLSGPITLNTTPTITMRGEAGNGAGQGSFEIASNLTGPNGITVTTTTTPLILSGNNSYSGTTGLAQSLLEAGSTTGFSPNSPVVMTNGNATLRLNGFSNTIASLSGTVGAAGSVDNDSTTPATITFGGDNTSTTFAGQFNNYPYGATAHAPLSLTKVGSGALSYIGGNGSNPYSGTTQVSGGTLTFDYSQYSGTQSNKFSTGASPLVLAGGVFQLKGLPGGGAASQSFSGLTLNPGSSVVNANNVPGATSTTVDLRGSAGTLGISRVTGGLVDFTASNGTLGSTSIIKTHQANDASGILGGWATVAGGTGYAANSSDVVVPYAGYININTQGSTIGDGATTNIQISAVTSGGNDTLATSTVNVNTLFQNAAGPATIATASQTLRLGPSGGILLSPTAGGLTIGANPGDGTLTAGKSDLSQGGELILNNNSANPLVINASIADNAPGEAVAVTKAGAGSLVLAGSNTFSGGLYINGGLVQLASSGALNAAGANSVTFGSGLNIPAKLQLNGNSLTINGLASPLSTSAVVESGSTTGSTDVLTVNTNGTNVFAGVLQNGTSGTLGLIMSGTGSLALNGQNTFSGPTTIIAGTLSINGTLPNSPVTVGSGGVLTGSGSIGNAALNSSVTVNSGGWITPGIAGVGPLNIATSGSVTLGSMASASMAVAVGASSPGLLNISGNLSSASQVTVYPSLASGDTPATTATIAQWTSGTGPSSGWTLNFSRASSSVVHWLGGTDSNWSTAANWDLNALTSGNLVYTSTSIQVTGMTTAPSTPLATNAVVIAPASNVTVTSPSSATTVASLSVGAQTAGNTPQLTLGGPLTVSGTTTVNAQGTLDLGGNTLTSGRLNVAGILQGSGGLIAGPTLVQAGGTMLVTTSNFGTGALTVNGGTLQFGQDSPADVSTGRTLAIGPGGLTINANGHSGTLAGPLGGNGGLMLQGNGATILAGSNTYTGGTTINNGTLQLGDGSSSNGSVQGNILNNSTLVFANPAAQIYGGVISGNGNLTLAGSGTLTFTGANTYFGNTTISAGALVIANTSGSALGSNSSILTLNGGTLAGTISGGTISGPVQAGGGAHNIAPGAGLAAGQYGILNLNGGLTTNNFTTLAFNLNGTPSGYTDINGNNIYAGDLINMGSSALTIGPSTAIRFGANPMVAGDYRLLYDSGSISGLGNFTLPNQAGYSYSLSTTADSTSGYIDLVVTSTGAGGGTWNFSGTGTSWAAAGDWSSGPVPSSGPVTFAGTPSTPTTVTLDGNQSAGSLVFNVSGSNGYTLSQGTGGGALTLGTLAGASIAVVSGTHTISAPVVLAGSLAVSTTGGGVLDISGSVSEATPGLPLSLSGDGELILSGTGGYTGGTTVESGTLCMTTATALASGSNLTVGAGGTFIFDPSVTIGPTVVSGDSSAGTAVAAVPEPGTLALLSAGLAAALMVLNRKRRASEA